MKRQEKHQKAFEKITITFNSELAFVHYDPKKQVIVATDASSYGMGAVLMHEIADGTIRPVIHAASSFNKAEKNKSREKHWLWNLQSSSSIATFAVEKECIFDYTESWLQRYALILLAYDFTIKYIDTNSFAYANVISRLMAKQEKPQEGVVIATLADGRTESGINAPLQYSDMFKARDVCQANVKNHKEPNSNVSYLTMLKTSVVALGIRSDTVGDGYITRNRATDETIGCFAIDTA